MTEEVIRYGGGGVPYKGNVDAPKEEKVEEKPEPEPEKPKTFQVKFGNLIALWNREIVFHLNFYLDIRKK